MYSGLRPAALLLPCPRAPPGPGGGPQTRLAPPSLPELGPGTSRRNPAPGPDGTEGGGARPGHPLRPSPARPRGQRARARGVLRRPPEPGTSAGAAESPRGGAAPPARPWLPFKPTFRNARRAGAGAGRLPYLAGEPLPGRGRTSRAREAEALEAAGMAARPGAREGARPRGSAGLLARPDRPAAPRGRRRAEAPGGGEGARRPESWVRVGPARPGRIGRSAGRRLRARRGEGAGARPAEGPPRSRPQPAARPPPGAPLGLADLPGEPSPLPPRVTATPCARARAQPSAPRAPRARTPLPGARWAASPAGARGACAPSSPSPAWSP